MQQQQQLLQFGLDIDKIQQVVKTRWLKPQEVLKILQNHELFTISHKPPQKPQSGSWFLFDRRVLRYFRSDGFEWQKKNNGKTINEAHELLKVDYVDALNCYYARGDKDPTFQRRIYWMLDPAYEHIVLVHYRDVLDGSIVEEVSSRTSASVSDLIQHRAALWKLNMQLTSEDKEDCDVNAHPCPSAIDVLKNSDTWLEEDQLEAILHPACMTLTENQCFKIHEVSPESAFSFENRKKRKRHHYPTSIQAMELNILERVVAGSEEPSYLDLSFLQRITENFSEQRKIGIGGCGEVYKGILRNRIVVVKRLFKSRTVKDKMFHREVKSLITARHQNIVRFLGYCSFTEERALTFEGGTIMVDIRERLLCFEYISNGSLEIHLTDELRGLEWHKRYEIIVGICMGLLYLHKEKNIVHMDLKPANILLDDLMVPKITDFGLSRLDNNSQAVTTSRFISLGYYAPEYLLEGKSSSESDIYSLGIIITELVTGSKMKPDVTKVLKRWKHRGMKSLEAQVGYQQVTKCLELVKRCMQTDPARRPDIVDITQELNAMDSKDDQFQEISCLDDMLGIEPLEIHFPFELEPQKSHSIELTNHTNDHIAFMMTVMLHCFLIEPDKGIVPPQSQCSVTIKMQAQVKEHELPNNHYKEKITVQSTIVDGGLAAMDITGDVFIEKESIVVDEVNVMIVFYKQPSADVES